MRLIKVLVTGYVIMVLAVSARADQSVFIAQVNAAWTSSNHAEILRLINVAKANPPVKPEVFAASFGYSIFILNDRSQATSDLNNLIEAVPSTATRARGALQEYREAFIALPTGSSTSRTVQQLAQLQSIFPNEFPINNLLVAIAAGP